MPAKKSSKLPTFIAKYGFWFILTVIVLIAIWFRFYQLDSLPPGLHPDEAANGQDVFRIFAGDIRPLYATNGPRESLFFFFQAIFVKTLGNTILALRIAPALFGVLAVIAVYFWASDWFGRRVGLFAAFFMAINPWVVIISRDGFRASMTPLLVASVAYFGGKAIKTKKTAYYIAAGITLGLGAYTYTAYQLMLAATVGLFVYTVVFRRQWIKNQYRNIIAAIIAFAIVLSPLAVFSIRNPEAAARAGGTSFLNPSLNNGKPLATLWDSTQKTLLQYNFRGDDNARHNVPGEPYLNTFVGIMFVLGILVSLFAIHHTRYFAVLFIAFAMMLPAALTAEGLPHGLRSIGSAPGVMIVAAIGLSYFLGRWYAIFPINSLARNIGLSLVVVLLGATLVQNYRAYFTAWAGSEATYEAYAEDNVELAKYMLANAQGSSAPKVYNVLDGYSIRTLEYLLHDKTIKRERVEWDQVKSLPLTEEPTIFTIQNNNHTEEVTTILKAKYPNGRLLPQYSPAFSNRLLFYTYEVNR
ncbi:glycosyltransferase family 39 protein [Candidatus Saccharibacteria bacterium]|nr:glycosyltransferase family 39 protein [Candidatus Saccharibacteria bacterium]